MLQNSWPASLHLLHQQCRRKEKTLSIPNKMMYCLQIWHPFLIKDILHLERVQRRASKYILSDFTSSYKARLLKINLLPIMYILELNELIFFIKSNFFPSKHFNVFKYVTFSSTNTRSSSKQKLIHHCSSTSSHFHFYFIRIVRLWNCLPYINLSLPFPLIKCQLFTVFGTGLLQILMTKIPVLSITSAHVQS